MNSALEVGDIIRVDRVGYKHVGVYVGPRGFTSDCVVHNSKGGGVILSDFVTFSGGTPIFIHQKATGNYYQREIIARRALALLGKKYDLLTFNCEHAANLAQRGTAESPQVLAMTFIALIVGGIALFTSKKT